MAERLVGCDRQSFLGGLAPCFCLKQAARFPIPPIQSNTVKARHQNRLVGCQQSCGNQNSTTRYTYRLHVQVRKPTMQNSTGSQLHVTNNPTPAPPPKKNKKTGKKTQGKNKKTQKQGKKKGKKQEKKVPKKKQETKTARKGRTGPVLLFLGLFENTKENFKNTKDFSHRAKPQKPCKTSRKHSKRPRKFPGTKTPRKRRTG